MAVRYITDSIFLDQSNALVCPVNTVGVMGAGLAKEFSKRYPDILPAYQELCRNGTLRVGNPFSVGLTKMKSDIILFPTKIRWQDPSQIEWIDTGLREMINRIKTKQWTYDSIAVPALGCGLGGLKWSDVKELMDVYFDQVPTNFRVYKPV